MSDEATDDQAEHNDSQWDFYFQHVDGEPASIMLDFAFDGYAPMDGFPKLTMVFVDMDEPGEHGLGTEAEEAGFTTVEQALQAAIEEAGAYFVGRTRTTSQWQMAYYSAADVDAEALAGAVLDELGRDYATHSQDDAEWQYYTSFLTPSDERRQWMADRNVVAELAANGDDLSKVRTLDHYAYFQDAAKRDAFVGAAKEAGFAGEAADDQEGDWPFVAHVTGESAAALEVSHKAVMAVKKLAEANDGWYDGWGCPVQS